MIYHITEIHIIAHADALTLSLGRVDTPSPSPLVSATSTHSSPLKKQGLKMAISSPTSHFTFTPLVVAFLLLCNSTPILAINITALLSSFPELSSFATLISSAPSVASDLSRRTSITLLAVPNSYLAASADLTRRLSPSSLADLLRYHVLLQFLSWSDLSLIPPSGTLVTTLFQTTGRASSNFGSVNITRNPSTNAVTVRSPAPYSPSNATVLSLVKTLPYNITIFSVNSLLIPYGFDLMASETRPTPAINITKALMDGHDFNVAASMLLASGVLYEFEADEGGAGITMFVPTDAAFADLPSSVNLQSLSAEKKATVLRFHVLHSYYPLGSLESIVNPLQPTLATEAMGAGSYTLNISRVNGSATINTGIVQGSVTQTVFDQKPVAIFGVSQVLLPIEIYRKVTTKPINIAQSPEISPSPDSTPGLDGPSSSPPGVGVEIRSWGARIDGMRNFILAQFCIGLYLLV
ncbi:fasciclin-like arabinogalactan protein 4-like [Tripterygium wilfordii]|uniref:Fasciclin-like arabinogalactan protein 4-like n=1 Tax=Tripterygium wilfordii TaxID=458696 RepID=A0A7J7DYW0_TRIWF|nr:fasciclin-like arabinogalactan protein 4 [Tripterygium wilfordii]KAF5751459.1 fasciclin-like arabinogalactan protein 4-like [Tripterygium wilfordii]